MRTKAIIATITMIVLLACAGCEEWSDSTTTKGKKSVLAVQAFIDHDSDERIMAICNSISGVEGYSSDLNPGGFIPHITIAASWATQAEMSKAEPQFAKRLTGLSRMRVSMTLEEVEKEDGRLHYFLLPEPTKELLQFHAQVHKKLDWPYPPFRQMDLPGNWRPHLTLFSIPKSQRHQISDALLQLRKVRIVQIERLALIGFGPMRILHEVKLEEEEPAR